MQLNLNDMKPTTHVAIANDLSVSLDLWSLTSRDNITRRAFDSVIDHIIISEGIDYVQQYVKHPKTE